jgi:hypothetical protein
MKSILTVIICMFVQFNSFAQNAIAVSASRIYFGEGGSKEQAFIIKNPNSNDTLNIKVSVHDWDYDSLGNNRVYNVGELANSLANYLTIYPGNYKTLAPGATDTIRISIKDVPADSITVRTAMLYLTQLDKENIVPTAIKALVQIGVKIYYKNNNPSKSEIQLSDFNFEQNRKEGNRLKLLIHNTGNIWLDGTIHFNLLDLNTREMIRLGKSEFFSLPADKQWLSIELPDNLRSGKYKAYAELVPITNNSINNVELIFTK